MQPTANIDMDGNSLHENTQDRQEHEEHPNPLDFVKVKNRRIFRQERKEMSESLSEQVKKLVNEFIDDKKQDPNLKIKPKIEMSYDKRQQEIIKMLQRSQLNVGVAPIASDHINRVQNNLVKRGVIDPKLPNEQKHQITIKSLVKTWSKKHLKMTDIEWEQIEIDEISTTDNSDIIFIKCKSQDDATKITSRAKYLPNDSGPDTPRIVMHIDICAKKRHQALQKVAKTICEH